MILLPGTGDLALRYAPYIEELQEFFAVHDLRYGAPDDLTLLAHRLHASETFAAELASMVRSFIFRERAAIPHSGLLAIVALSSGGSHIQSYAYDLQPSLEDLYAFLATLIGMPLGEPQQPRHLPAEPAEPGAGPLIAPIPVAPLTSVTSQPRASLPFAEPPASVNPFNTGVPADKFLAAAMLTAADLQRSHPAELAEPQPAKNRRLWVGAIALPFIALAAFLLNRSPAPADPSPSPATISASAAPPTQHPQPKPTLTAPLPLTASSSHGIPALPSPTISPSSVNAPVPPRNPESTDPSTVLTPTPSPQPAPTQSVGAETTPPVHATGGAPTRPSPPRPSASASASTTQGASVIARRQATGISSGIMSSHLLSYSQPPYPKMAHLTHAEGTVILQAVISKSGKVIAAHALSGPRTLRKSAANTVRTWRYRPYVAEGRPVDVATIITIDFKAPPLRYTHRAGGRAIAALRAARRRRGEESPNSAGQCAG